MIRIFFEDLGDGFVNRFLAKCIEKTVKKKFGLVTGVNISEFELDNKDGENVAINIVARVTVKKDDLKKVL